MGRALAGLLVMLVLLTHGCGTVTATGDASTSLAACTNQVDGYYGGVKVYGRDRGTGASRVMCPPTELLICQPPDCDPPVIESREGGRVDINLNGRNKNRPPNEDIWNGFDRNIESLRLRADAGCAVGVILLGRVPDLPGPGDPNVLFRVGLDNYAGATPVTRLVEVPRGKDDRAWGVWVGVVCDVAEVPG